MASLVAIMAHAAKFNSTEKTLIEEPRPADVPSDATLEAQGAIIGAIEFDIRQIFDEHDARENSGLYHFADQLHVRTKESTIRAQLLFRSGDRYRAQKLAETERNLRAVHYINDAHVVPVKYAQGKVTVRVITKDVWTLSPGVSFGRSGGANSSSVDLSDSNLLGSGKSLALTHASNVDRRSTGVTYGDPNVLRSRWTLATGVVNASDGNERSFALAQPFYSLDTPWTVTVKASQFDRTVSRYNLGDIVDQFKREEAYYELSGGVSSGLIDGHAGSIPVCATIEIYSRKCRGPVRRPSCCARSAPCPIPLLPSSCCRTTIEKSATKTRSGARRTCTLAPTLAVAGLSAMATVTSEPKRQANMALVESDIFPPFRELRCAAPRDGFPRENVVCVEKFQDPEEGRAVGKCFLRFSPGFDPKRLFKAPS